MTWEPRPLPKPTPETAAFWEAATEGQFLLSECGDCGLTYHYPRALCPDCFSDDVEWREAEGTGEVYSYTVMRGVSGWPESALPLVYAHVELDEGPRVITNVVDCDPDAVEVGMPVEVRFEATDREDVAVPVFVPRED